MRLTTVSFSKSYIIVESYCFASSMVSISVVFPVSSTSPIVGCVQLAGFPLVLEVIVVHISFHILVADPCPKPEAIFDDHYKYCKRVSKNYEHPFNIVFLLSLAACMILSTKRVFIAKTVHLGIRIGP